MRQQQKTFLLIAPDAFNLHELFISNLANLGYETVHIGNERGTFKYKNFCERIKNFFYKTFLGDREYKRKLRIRYDDNRIKALLNSFEYFDVCLVIRADLFQHNFLKNAKRKCGKFVSFHYDGIDRTSNIFSRIRLFDKFYVFDEHDLGSYKQYPLYFKSNFYFDIDQSDLSFNIDSKNDIYYLSSFHLSRIETIIAFHKQIVRVFDSVKFELIYWDVYEKQIPSYAKEHFNCSLELKSYAYQMNMVKHSKAILDFCIDEHQGLSLRIFDGLKYRKKVVTNNPIVLEQDFYHPNNFFLWDSATTIEDLLVFFKKPYQVLDEKLIAKY